MKIKINSLGEVIDTEKDQVLGDNDIKKLPGDTQSLIKKVWAIQDAVTYGRFRAYYTGGQIRLVTEFIYFSDEIEIAKGIRWLARELGAKVWVMHESPHCDKVTYMKGERTLKTVTGINHDRMETQVELSWPLKSPCDNVVAARMIRDAAREETQALWENYGVSVT